MTTKIKKFALALGLLAGVMIIVFTNREPSNATMSVEPHVGQAVSHYVVETTTQWIMQSASTLLQIK